MTSVDYVCSYEIYNLLNDILKRREVSAENLSVNFGEKICGTFEIPLREFETLNQEFEEIKYRGYLNYQKK